MTTPTTMAFTTFNAIAAIDGLTQEEAEGIALTSMEARLSSVHSDDIVATIDGLLAADLSADWVDAGAYSPEVCRYLAQLERIFLESERETAMESSAGGAE